MTDFLAILVGVALVNHLVLARYPAFSPLAARRGRLRLPRAHAFAMTLALTLAMATVWLLDSKVFQDLGFRELRLPVLILAAMAAVPLAALPARMTGPAAAPGRALLTIDCAMLGAALLATRELPTLTAAVAWAVATALGFLLLLPLLADIDERLESAEVPPRLAGAAIMLVTAGLMSLAFSGVAGMVRG